MTGPFKPITERICHQCQTPILGVEGNIFAVSAAELFAYCGPDCARRAKLWPWHVPMQFDLRFTDSGSQPSGSPQQDRREPVAMSPRGMGGFLDVTSLNLGRRGIPAPPAAF